MSAHLHDWINLLLRWSHLITGIAWIGASFYFNWLENRLQRQRPPPGYAGDLWAVHGGGFYYLRKLAVAPDQLPSELHWFKWEAYATWLTGFALLCVVYYRDASLFLLRPESAIGPALAITLGIAALALSWLLYDGLCRWLSGRNPALLAALVLSWFTLLAWLLGLCLPPRAAWIHVGAAIGTVMVANVFRVIIPAQKELVAAVRDARTPDAAVGTAALLRSRHNNYLTLPVLFLMVSIHYPGVYGRPHAWLALLGISLGAVGIRHYFNVRHLGGRARWFLLGGAGLLLLTALMTAPRTPAESGAAQVVPDADVMAIVQRRCTGCHSRTPKLAGFTAAPLGIVLDTPDDLERYRRNVYQSVAAQTMPLGNITQMSERERRTVVNWHLAKDRD